MIKNRSTAGFSVFELLFSLAIAVLFLGMGLFFAQWSLKLLKVAHLQDLEKSANEVFLDELE